MCDRRCAQHSATGSAAVCIYAPSASPGADAHSRHLEQAASTCPPAECCVAAATSSCCSFLTMAPMSCFNMRCQQVIPGLPRPLVKICDFGYSKHDNRSVARSKVVSSSCTQTRWQQHLPTCVHK